MIKKSGAANSDSAYIRHGADAVEESLSSKGVRLFMSRLEREIADNPSLLRQYQDLVKAQFGLRFYWEKPTAHDIVKLLELEEVERRISQRRARLLFDGQYLEWIEDGRIQKRWPAISGRVGYNGKEHQTLRDIGPLPEGNYIALQSDFQKWEETSVFNRATCMLNFIGIKAGRWPGCTIAWGTRRVGLRPSPGTQVFGRDNFTIHGGWTPGSAGCIDLTDSMDAFAKEFLLYAKDMELEVRY